MKSQNPSITPENVPTSSSELAGLQNGSALMRANAANLQALDGRLEWLDLHTSACIVNRALRHLFTEAMQETNDAKRVGRYLLSLWSPSQYPLDLNELGFLDRELNYSARHLANFIIGCQLNFRELVTYSQMAPIIAAWGDQQE